MAIRPALVLTVLMACSLCAETEPARATQPSRAQAGVLFPPAVVEAARHNAATLPWGKTVRDHVVTTTSSWANLSDDELWSLVFGPTITRSWMVWSNGHCPACEKSVPMYNWEMDALKQPWKTRCPHCKALFPTNDFARYYRTGLDEHGIFDPKKADRTLLFNTAHPDPNDPLHQFGVIAVEELARVDGSLALGLAAHTSLGTYPIYAFGTEEQRRRWVPRLASGKGIAAFALTEPDAGSDAQGTRTTAVQDGDGWLVNGTKFYCTNGTHASTIVFTAVTGTAPGGKKEISAFVVEKGTPGLKYGAKEVKLGMRSSDTRVLHFEDMRLPAGNLLGGPESRGAGFKKFMLTLDGGRISVGAISVGLAQGAIPACRTPWCRRKCRYRECCR